ncbi:MAG: hypothetical protein J6S11_02990 [Bacteroidaceae bacterium]|nr:hypothetical protein [Bacteroidaceae bacterium]
MIKIVHFIVHNKVATLVAALLCACLWLINFVTGDIVTILSCVPIDSLSPTLQLIIAIVTYLMLGLLLIRTNERIAFNIPGKAALAGTLFFMSSALIPHLAANLTSTIHLVLLSTASYMLLCSYRQHEAMGYYFLSFALVGAASLISPSMLFVAPLLLICCSLLQSLHIRTILASIFGLLLPYWIVVCGLFLTDTPLPTEAFVNALIPPATAQPDIAIYGYTLSAKIPQLAWLILLIVPSIIVTFFSRSALKARTQSSLYFLTTAILLMLACIIIVPGFYPTISPLLFLAVSISSSCYFISNPYQGAKIYLIFLIVVWLLIAALFVWSSF